LKGRSWGKEAAGGALDGLGFGGVAGGGFAVFGEFEEGLGLGLGLCEGLAGGVDAFDGFAGGLEGFGFEDGRELGEFEVVDGAEVERGELGGEEVFEEFVGEGRLL